MANLERWLVGFMFVVTGLAGLFVASRSHEPEIYAIGLGAFVLSVLVTFWNIKDAYDRKE